MVSKNRKNNSDKKFEEDEEFERPDWDDEDYRSKAELEEDEEFERPDWDDEVWFKKLKRSFLHGYKPYVAVLAMVLIVVLALPSGRAGVLNQVGARGNVSFHVYDQETNEPLRNVKVTIGNNASMTNETGLVRFEGVKLGRQQMIVEKSAYESYNQLINVGWGDNQINDVSIEPVGKRFNFKVLDWLSLEPIEGAEVAFEDSVTTTNAEGSASLNIPAPESTVSFTVSADEYTTIIQGVLPENEEVVEIRLVAFGEHHYIGSQDNKNGVFSISADGSVKNRISEDNPTIFTVSPNGQTGVLLIDAEKAMQLKALSLSSGESSPIDSGPRMDLVGWIGDSVIYLKLNPDVGADSPVRHQLMSYNVGTKLKKQLASANLFNDILVAEEYVFYAPSALNMTGSEEAALYRIRVDGSNKTAVTNQETWSVIRQSPDTIRYNADNQWYETQLETISQTPVEDQAREISKLYTDNPFNAQLSARVDSSGSKPTLLLVNLTTGEETPITSLSGMRDPLRWLSSRHLVFRVNTQNQTADYIININGGEPVKLTDVEDVAGIESWLFYFE